MESVYDDDGDDEQEREKEEGVKDFREDSGDYYEAHKERIIWYEPPGK